MSAYEDGSIIGSGGFGQVSRCTRVADGIEFAKKTLLYGDENAKRRFAREVNLLAKLDHPNIIRIVDAGLDGVPPWFVMPLYQDTLRQILPVNDLDSAKGIFGQILDGMEYAHGCGVIHRDLKPDNILLNSISEVVVSDFGLGRLFGGDLTSLTITGVGMGTEFYMAPEQADDSKRVGFSCDIYALGRILYEMMGGSIRGNQDTTEMDPAIGYVIERCTRRNPEARFQNIGDLRMAWGNATDREDPRADSERLRLLVAEFIPGLETAPQNLNEIFELLLRRAADNPEVLYETLMGLPADVIAIFAERSLDRCRDLIKRFTDYVEGEDWPFGETDKIGDFCNRIYAIISDAEIRAELLICVLELGVSHNRWHVLGLAEGLFKRPRNGVETIALAAHLKHASKRVKEWLQERFQPAALGNALNDVLKGQ